MSVEATKETVTFHLTWTDHAHENLSKRIEEFKRNNGDPGYDDTAAAIHSLRGIAARASHVLPQLYLALGAYSLPEDPAREHWRSVQAVALEQSALQTIAITCRAVFEESKKQPLSGRRIARLNDQTLASVARYWSAHWNKPEEEATQALRFLRNLFDRCARREDHLLKQSSLLERRIGLLKYYADRHAAHITPGHYLFGSFDLVHVAAAIVLIGAIITDFDNPWQGHRYFDSVDEGAWQAAKAVFPHLPIPRVFWGRNIHKDAALAWKQPDGMDYILDRLPTAIGFWDDRPDPE
jgi:hypothetical protein